MIQALRFGINCGFGNNDFATLTFQNFDLEGGWVSHPRPKNGTPRRCPLWNESIAAVQNFIKLRPRATISEYSDVVFLNGNGKPYICPSTRTQERLKVGRFDGLVWPNEIGKAMNRRLVRLGIKRKGLSFYSLRHNTVTNGGEAKDEIAIAVVMGHTPPGMATNYRDSVIVAPRQRPPHRAAHHVGKLNEIVSPRALRLDPLDVPIGSLRLDPHNDEPCASWSLKSFDPLASMETTA